jgi:hypothetical protein
VNTERESARSLLLRSNGPGWWIVGVVAVAVGVVAVAWLGIRATGAEASDIIVYKTPTCGCCNNWIEHLRDNGFAVDVVNVSETQTTRERFGVPYRMGSCHTAVVGEYWVEGHVPADLIKRLLDQSPGDIRGISVPGMPVGSPGMEGPNPVVYDVLAYGTDGRISVYATRHGRESPE